MKLLVMSDLHVEFHRDRGDSFLASLPDEEVDVCVLAGDISVGADIPNTLKRFCDKYEKVIYIHGNHEFYNSSKEKVIDYTLKAVEENSNLTWLHLHEGVPGFGTQEVAGQRFIGAPMWFPHSPDSSAFESGMNDFICIESFRDWVYEENKLTEEYISHHMEITDVVVTHHLPSHHSVTPQYKNSVLNPFFVCDMKYYMTEHPRPAKLWIHGHTHDSCDYTLGATRVVCNPLGYPHELNKEFEFKVIELYNE